MESPRTVLLVHSLPDGSAHIDWMVERPLPTPDAPSPAHRLATWRVVHRIDRPLLAPFRAIPLPDHRDRYLSYEGPVSGDRGEVRRLAAGVVVGGGAQARPPFSLRIAWDLATIDYRFTTGPDDTAVLVIPRLIASPD